MSTSPPFNVLVFSKTSGYRHSSIPAGIRALHSLASKSNAFTIAATEDSSLLTPSNLRTYAVIVLLQCIGDIFSAPELDALKGFVRAGGGVVAIHGAAAGMPNDEWYGKLVGAHFDMHPDPEPGTIVPEESTQSHFIANRCGGRKGWWDEWYNFHTDPRLNGNLDILLKGDTSTFQGGKMGDDHPLVWCQEFEGGRSFFTALGHFDEAYEDEWFLGMVEKGIFWAARREGMYSEQKR
ncbi:secreted glycosyl hydrolase [Phaeosphaeria sp. MPI-PUGE-AT-0046c]|nr:secreted glycosyl hydrolase [Phaeosphaeria sp. MPI-PUGE-AT-0046c]